MSHNRLLHRTYTRCLSCTLLTAEFESYLLQLQASLELAYSNRRFYRTAVAKVQHVADSFPAFTLGGCQLEFVTKFKYLGHIIDSTCSDDFDISREVKNLFTRTNVLCRRFKRCSVSVKAKLFRAFCLGMYDTALWVNFSAGAIRKMASCYIKCIKSFFGYSKYSSVTNNVYRIGSSYFQYVGT